jgi:hypothetical protein
METVLFGIVYFAGPPILAGVAMLLLGTGLAESLAKSWWKILVSALVLSGLIGWIFFLASLSGDFLLPIPALLMSGVVFICAASIVWTLPRWRKLIGLSIGILFPLATYIAMDQGIDHSPDVVTSRNAEVIVLALQRYHTDHGQYPANLTQLVPDYLAQIPEKLITVNTPWQYKSDSKRFDFGYLEYPDTLARSWICSYASDEPIWNCTSGNFKPFGWIPTP